MTWFDCARDSLKSAVPLELCRTLLYPPCMPGASNYPRNSFVLLQAEDSGGFQRWVRQNYMPNLDMHLSRPAEIEAAKGFLAKIHGGVLRFPNLKVQLYSNHIPLGPCNGSRSLGFGGIGVSIYCRCILWTLKALR